MCVFAGETADQELVLDAETEKNLVASCKNGDRQRRPAWSGSTMPAQPIPGVPMRCWLQSENYAAPTRVPIPIMCLTGSALIRPAESLI